MALTYLVLAHQRPDLLGELARITEGHRLVVHIDVKADPATFQRAAPRAQFIADRDRVDVQWGQWSVVKATLALMKAARVGLSDHATLISGDSAPIRTRAAIDEFLAAHRGVQFIDSLPIHDDREATRRLTRVHVEKNPDSGWRMRLANRGRRALDHRLLGGREPRWGSMWWTLTGDAIDWTLDTLDRDRELRRIYRLSHIPDEGLFQTLIASSPFADEIRPSLMYAEIPHGDPHARPLDGHDLNATTMTRPFGTQGVTIDGPALWARKFTTPEAMSAARR